MQRLVVSGDLVIDHHIYEGVRTSPGQQVRGVVSLTETGGAVQLRELLRHALTERGWNVELGVLDPETERGTPGATGPEIQHAFALWAPHPVGKDEKVWRPVKALGYGEASGASAQLLPQSVADGVDVLVLDDANDTFRLIGQRQCWHLDAVQPAGWIVLKHCHPLARGDLWSALLQQGRHKKRFVCVVAAADLRRELVSFRAGLSWDQTVREVHAALKNSFLKPLQECAHLVVTFSTDGALWIHGKEAKLLFTATGYEGAGQMGDKVPAIGGMSVMAAAVAQQVARQFSRTEALDLTSALRAGLAGMRNLDLFGHGSAKPVADATEVVRDKPAGGFPARRIADVLQEPDSKHAELRLRWQAEIPPISIIASTQYPPGVTPPLPTIGLAREITMYGTRALSNIPHMVIGSSVIVDPAEIESLRGLERALRDYQALPSEPGKTPKPYSIGVFGPPGAGKSRGVKDLAQSIFDRECWLEFNLSQFDGARDLRGALQQVRDVALNGRLPVVFWDEFDTNELYWLRYLLAPMQDGQFQDGDLNHAVGKAVFIFAGGTSERFAEFPQKGAGAEGFRMKKGPDFVSRLDAFHDVAGANQRQRRGEETETEKPKPVNDPSDVTYPVRRALMIRHHLKCVGSETLEFDSGLLDALLLIPRYRHGSRSLEKLVQPLRPEPGAAVLRSSLPSTSRIHMHVDAAAFDRIMTRLEWYPSEDLEPIARAIYAGWRQAALSDPAVEDKPPDYDNLEPVEREVNLAAARRLPDVLAMAGLTVRKTTKSLPKVNAAEFRDLVKIRLEIMAETEHDAWVRQRRSYGWRSAQAREKALRLHDTLVDYKDLPEKYRKKDKANIMKAWRRLTDAGFDVVWMSPMT